MQTEIQLTEDGSHTLYVPEIDECYHSSHGAIQESNHIFIKSGLRECKKEDFINVFEVGFGTGLNAYLAMVEADENKRHIDFVSIELFPVSLEKAQQLNFPEQNSNKKKAEFELLHKCRWNKKIQITDNFTLTKIKTDFATFECFSNYDICFFDAFSPEKQSEMWSENRFKMLFDYANSNAILTTYCAKGVVRRTLQNVGFTVERLPGPPGKREILRARKI